jgi:hypothetical protein
VLCGGLFRQEFPDGVISVASMKQAAISKQSDLSIAALVKAVHLHGSMYTH